MIHPTSIPHHLPLGEIHARPGAVPPLENHSSHPEGRRLSRDRVMGQETREQMIEHLRAHPGETMHSLCRALGLAMGTVEYHLDVLKHHQLIVERRDGAERSQKVFLYLSEQSKEGLPSCFQNKKLGKIWEKLQRCGPICHGDLLKILHEAGIKISPSTLSFHINHLKQLHLAQSEKNGRNSIISPVWTQTSSYANT